MSYCTTDEIYNATSLTSSVVSTAAVEQFIKAAEKRVDRLTFTTYWASQTTGTATAGSSTTLTDSSASWTVNAYTDMYVWIHAGTGAGQARKITSNTSTELTVDAAWDTNPSTDSEYRVFYTASNPNVNDSFDGTNSRSFYVDLYPIRILQSLVINGTTATTSEVNIYSNSGKLYLGDDAGVTYFDESKPQLVALNYWYGVYDIPEDVKRYVIVCASISTLESQMGGTYATPSSYSLPEGQVTIGQAYVNIRGTYDVLVKEKLELEKVLPKYPSLI